MFNHLIQFSSDKDYSELLSQKEGIPPFNLSDEFKQRYFIFEKEAFQIGKGLMMNAFEFDSEFEKAMKLLVSFFPEEPMKKPTLFHSMRVGVFLWNNGYDEKKQISGWLHDALEDTNISEVLITVLSHSSLILQIFQFIFSKKHF